MRQRERERLEMEVWGGAVRDVCGYRARCSRPEDATASESFTGSVCPLLPPTCQATLEAVCIFVRMCTKIENPETDCSQAVQ